jgi:hypothetical protein
MRSFWRLSSDPYGTKLAGIDKHDFGEVDATLFCRGVPFDQPAVPECVKLFVNWDKLKRPDYMAGPISWPIASKRFVEVISRAASDFQALDLKLFALKRNKKTDEVDHGYVVLNATRRIPSINLEKSVVMKGPFGITVLPHGIVIDGARVPDSVHLFRAEEFPLALLISEELVSDMKGKKLTGVVLFPCQTI